MDLLRTNGQAFIVPRPHKEGINTSLKKGMLAKYMILKLLQLNGAR